MSDPFEDIIREQEKLNRNIQRTMLKEVPIYSKGVFTPTLVADTTPGTFTYDANTAAYYTRHDNRVFINGRVRITAITVAPVGSLRIGGLPITPVAGLTGNIAGGVAFSLWHGLTLTGTREFVGGRILSGVSSIQFIECGSGLQALGITGAALGLLGGFVDFQFDGHYLISL